jgi:hypothetical protein
MTKNFPLPVNKTGFILSTALLAALTGCVAEPPSTVYRGRPPVRVQATIAFQDDYVYYPGYETYYSQNRHEFVYLEGNAWVRRPEPRGVTASILFAAPSVRLDFHDSPEQHHYAVAQSYPRNWAPPGYRQEERVVVQRPEPRNSPRADMGTAQVVVVAQDDYEYYPGYETYYSRTRHEYVYREGNTWVRRPEPKGVAVNVLIASPSVALDFHDSPEQHHGTVVQKYPRNWKKADKDHDGKDDKNDKNDDKKRGHDDDRQ